MIMPIYDLLIFIILDDKGKGVQMTIVITRNIMNEILTTYLPTALLIIIVYATTFFKQEFFEAALSVNLSVMFVMTTLFVSVMEKLPQTSYVRMVDVWLIFGQLLPFIEVVLITFMEASRVSSHEKQHGSQKNMVDSSNETDNGQDISVDIKVKTDVRMKAMATIY